MSRSTKHSYHVVNEDRSVMIEHDFIALSRRNYFYQSDVMFSDHLYKGGLMTFDRWRQEIIQQSSDFSWDQFTKLPYLYQSLAKTQQFRFPVIFHDDRMRCGTGRLFMARRFYPDIPIDAVVISDTQINCGQKLISVADLESKLLQKSQTRLHMTDQHIWTFSIVDDIITAIDCSADPNNLFPFCKDSEKNLNLVQRIETLVRDNANMDIENLLVSISLMDLD